MSFLALPFELREEVYQYVIQPAPATENALFLNAHHGWSLCLPTDFLVTCKQIAIEARHTLDRYQNFCILAEVFPPKRVAGFDEPESEAPDQAYPNSRPSGNFSPYRNAYPRHFTLLLNAICIGSPPAPLLTRFTITTERLSKFIPLLAAGPRIHTLTLRVRSFQQRNKYGLGPFQNQQKRLSELLQPLEGRVGRVIVQWEDPSSGGKDEMEEIKQRLVERKALGILNLPVEIRNLIYTELIATKSNKKQSETEEGLDRQVVFSQFTTESRPTTQKGRAFSVALLRSCRLLHNEAATLLYQTLTWSVNVDGKTLEPLPSVVCPSYSHLIENYKIVIHLGAMTKRKSVVDDLNEEIAYYCNKLRRGGGDRLKTLEVSVCMRCNQSTTGRLTKSFDEGYVQSFVRIVEPFQILADWVDTVIMGRILDVSESRLPTSWKGEFYRSLKVALGSEVIWKYPYPDKDVKD